MSVLASVDVERLHGLVDELAFVSVEALCRDGLDPVVDAAARLRSFADAVDVAVAHRVAALATSRSSESAADVLMRAGRRSQAAAKAAQARAEVCARMPAVEAALGHGVVNADHVDALAAATRHLDPDALARFVADQTVCVDRAGRMTMVEYATAARDLARAIQMTLDRERALAAAEHPATPDTSDGAGVGAGDVTGTGDSTGETVPGSGLPADAAPNSHGDADPCDLETGAGAGAGAGVVGGVAGVIDHEALILEQQRRDSKVFTWTDKVTGMVKIHGELDPVTGAAFTTALEHRLRTVKQRDETAGVPIDRLRVDALIELVTGARTTEPDGEPVPEIIVVIDHHTLIDGIREHSLCETSDGTMIPISTARRLCCNARIIPAVLDGAGRPLDVGAAQRTATRHQRRALKAAYRTCAVPGCAVPFERCQIHHLTPWEHGGPTNLNNLIPICLEHHHLIHEGGWHLTMTPDRVVTLTRPDGTTHATELTCDRWPHHRRQPPTQPPTGTGPTAGGAMLAGRSPRSVTRSSPS